MARTPHPPPSTAPTYGPAISETCPSGEDVVVKSVLEIARRACVTPPSD
ncbi:MAG: hypothetical protein AVDCRST_MAG66-662 [uncultured Pseudonocardia sp.]|uniref:Uncharacterized protein n=1 Tax=uncultured Pseudonocardia sp. TaxID=211455 RepID=A0A6J4NGK0_9PSEU|nr:MAG: hypothetical protein AVDCRST_MAG66-662 [uncultured Pseudonocardia sp.]